MTPTHSFIPIGGSIKEELYLDLKFKSDGESGTNYNEDTKWYYKRYDLRKEDHRLATLEDWPQKANFDIEAVAKNGFYYTGEEDTICCFSCQVKMSKWQLGDNVQEEHKKCSEKCPFLLRQPVGNVPMTPKKHIEINNLMKNAPAPRFPTYSTVSSRIHSFTYWPSRMTQKPEDMAEAGFFYLGEGDKACCYHCGGVVFKWEENDVPLEEHARWYNRCLYVKNVKGSEYIKMMDTKPKSKLEDKNETNDKGKEIIPDEKLCKICYTNECNAVVIPCGHVVSCMSCARKFSGCPVCRTTIAQVMKIHLT